MLYTLLANTPVRIYVSYDSTKRRTGWPLSYICLSYCVHRPRTIVAGSPDVMHLTYHTNKHIYSNSPISIQKYLRTLVVPPMPLRLCRLISHVPLGLVTNLKQRAVQLFDHGRVSSIKYSDLEQVKLDNTKRSEAFFVSRGRIKDKGGVGGMPTLSWKQYWNLLKNEIKCSLADIPVMTDNIELSFIRTKKNYNMRQRRHRDYPPECILGRKDDELPWFSIIPLTEQGSHLFVWEGPEEPMNCVYIPYGFMLLVRGDVLHAGGLPPDVSPGKEYLRLHCFIPTERGDVSSPNLSYDDDVGSVGSANFFSDEGDEGSVLTCCSNSS